MVRLFLKQRGEIMSKKIFIDKDIIVPIYEKTNSVNQTAKELNISWNTCKRILNEYGIEAQKRNQAGIYREYDLFSKIKTSEDAYWLGVMYSDGWVRSDRNEIGLGSVDLDLIEKFKQYTNSPNKIQIKEKNYAKGKKISSNNKIIKSSKTFYQLTFSSKKTKENLKNLGCMPAKSKILVAPNSEQVPDEFIFDFLRGYTDGDGSIRYGEKTNYTIIGTQNFLQQITKRAKINHYGKITRNNSVYRFDIYKKEIVKKVLNDRAPTVEEYAAIKKECMHMAMNSAINWTNKLYPPSQEALDKLKTNDDTFDYKKK